MSDWKKYNRKDMRKNRKRDRRGYYKRYDAMRKERIRNREEYFKGYYLARQEKVRALRHKLIGGAGGACKQCGKVVEEWQFEFHHRDKDRKNFELSGNNILSYSVEELLAEIKKCDLLCSTCHRVITNHDKTGMIYKS